MPRVLRLCHKFLEDDDGYDLDIQDLCKSTGENYVLTYIRTSAQDYSRKNKLQKKGKYYYHKGSGAYIIPVEYQRKYKNYLKDLYLLRNIRPYNEAFRQALELKPDIVHIHGTLLPQFLYAAFKSRSVATHHIGLINQGYRKQKLHILFSKFIIHNIFPLVSKVICVSRHGRKSFLFRKGIKVINPVPVIRKPARARFKADFCCIGRFCRQKNQLNIVLAFKKALMKNPKLTMVFAGQRTDMGYFKKVVAAMGSRDNYKLIGRLDNRQALGLIKSCSCLVSVSHNEGFGRNAMEAMLLGKPIIAARGSGYEDFIDEGLVDPDNIDEIAKAMVNMPRARKAKYSHEEYVKRIMGVYGGAA